MPFYFSGAYYAEWLSLQIACGNKGSESRKERGPAVSINAGQYDKHDDLLLLAMQGWDSE